MNSYKFSLKDGAGESVSFITAVDEKEAKRLYRQTHSAEETREASITLHQENVPATKQQERDALVTIRAIIETLGPSSYVATALEGCLEDADTNIEYDFGDSMKGRWQYSEAQLKAEKEAHAETKRELETARRALLDAEKNADFFRDKVLDDDDMLDVAMLVDEKTYALEEAIKDAANRIVEAAGEPEGKEFQQAVTDHRALKGKLAYYKELAQRIAHVQGK